MAKPSGKLSAVRTISSILRQTINFMKKIETSMPEQEKKFGVLKYKTENNHYVVNIRWKDGKEVEEHFPVAGFIVVNPATGEKRGHIDGKRALKILEENTAKMTADEFSWLDFVGGSNVEK